MHLQFAVEMARDGRVSAIMKGMIYTDDLMGAVVSRLGFAFRTKDEPHNCI